MDKKSVESSEKVAVCGGGISGLLMAKELADSGKQVTVFEGGNKLGGKIQTKPKNGVMDEHVINLGAEFIDSEKSNPRMIALCKELGVKLIPAEDQKTEQFNLPDGTMVSGDAFHAAYKPLAEQIIKDKQNLIVDGKYTARALQLNDMSMIQYLESLAGNVKGGVDPKIIETAARVYGSESGRDPSKISALQFVNEASSELGSFLGSDCAYRVEGGTARIIDALYEYLEKKGVEFKTNSKVTNVQKENGKFRLGFEVENGAGEFDKVALALPAYALGKIEGLENLGMTREEKDLLSNTQYTHSAKFFVKVKDGVDIDNACFFSGDGFQAWTSEKGMVTFLAGGETINQHKGIELINHCLEKYATAHGKKVDDIFEVAPDKMVFGAPDTKKPCYASPALGQLIGLGGLFGTMERMAKHGVAIAGTFFPRRDADGTGIGFMECGAASVARAAKLLNHVSLEQKMENTRDNMQSWVQKMAGNPQTGMGASYLG